VTKMVDEACKLAGEVDFFGMWYAIFYFSVKYT
jgi:hypothetical protein